nr:MAG TPA: hypothetical protein [Caudoviricetes sp.]
MIFPIDSMIVSIGSLLRFVPAFPSERLTQIPEKPCFVPDDITPRVIPCVIVKRHFPAVRFEQFIAGGKICFRASDMILNVMNERRRKQRRMQFVQSQPEFFRKTVRSDAVVDFRQFLQTEIPDKFQSFQFRGLTNPEQFLDFFNCFHGLLLQNVFCHIAFRRIPEILFVRPPAQPRQTKFFLSFRIFFQRQTADAGQRADRIAGFAAFPLPGMAQLMDDRREQLFNPVRSRTGGNIFFRTRHQIDRIREKRRKTSHDAVFNAHCRTPAEMYFAPRQSLQPETVGRCGVSCQHPGQVKRVAVIRHFRSAEFCGREHHSPSFCSAGRNRISFGSFEYVSMCGLSLPRYSKLVVIAS